jgi:hypothetical protein
MRVINIIQKGDRPITLVESGKLLFSIILFTGGKYVLG